MKIEMEFTSLTVKSPTQIRAERREEIRQQVREGLLTEAEGEEQIEALRA